ncbi:MAG: type II toxin-antitoxin system RelE/ParE family toxin [Nanoarchaeota archaeon]|nr:type II toxin-antitoxin system RelE/ParE family toxin [Nanoarchaeota archaeon]MBU0977424.1 type II toxin-antitoxin system RelE/ParE family toxin [Nanoarchaeota archaeon]
MVNIKTSEKFERILDKIDKSLKIQIDKQIDKIIANPEVGKPMRNVRKGTRELYVGPLRLSYFYDKNTDTAILLDFYHKDEQ